MLKKALFAVAASSVMAFGAQAAQTIDFSSGHYDFQSIGADAEGSEFDHLIYDGITKTGFDVSVPTEYVVAGLSMIAGPNCYAGDTCVSGQQFDRSVDFTVNGVTKALHLAFQWDISDTADSITFSKPAGLSFNLAGGAKLAVDFFTPGALVVPSGSDLPAQSSLKAKFTVTPAVPEPATYAMLFAGLAVVGAVARRKSQA